MSADQDNWNYFNMPKSKLRKNHAVALRRRQERKKSVSNKLKKDFEAFMETKKKVTKDEEE